MSDATVAAEQFYRYFSDEIIKIGGLSADSLYKKILCASMLDSLGKARFPEKGNRRIVDLIDNYSNWTDKNRVSLVQLGIYLDRIHGHSRELVELVQSGVGMMESGRIYRSDCDPFKSDLAKKIPQAEIVLIDKFQYLNLFYHYRHTMIHEFREPAHPMEISQDASTPYYHSYMKHDDGAFDRDSCSWELVFPAEVFKGICEDCIEGLKAYFIQNQIDPYKFYNFNDLWIPEDRI